MPCAGFAVIDGDTIACGSQHLRLLGDGAPYVSGVDAPESGGRAKCGRERALAQKAARRLAELATQAGVVIERSGVRDRYGRELATLRLPDGRSAGAALIAEGLAVVWRPGRHADWCR